MEASTLDSETRRSVLSTVDRFVQERLGPAAGRIDDEAVFPRDLYKEIADLGVLGLFAPPEYGGCGPDLIAPLVISERLARENVAFAVTVSNCGDCMGPILHAGSKEIKQQYLPGIVAGDLIPAFCLSEPSGGSDVAAMNSTAVRQGEDYILNGRKMWITSATVADVFIVFAKTDPALGHKGISAFVVPRDVEGIVVGKAEQLLGLRSSPTAEVSFTNVRIPAASRLGEEGDGFKLAMVTLDESRLHIASISLGAASKAVEVAVQYSRERKQFGKPLIEHQGMGFILADLVTELASGRALLSTAIASLVRSRGRKAGVYAAMAKLVCSDFAMSSAVKAAQVLGGYGLSKSYPLERLIRDCKALQIFEGSNEIQKWLIARELQREGVMLDQLEELVDV